MDTVVGVKVKQVTTQDIRGMKLHIEAGWMGLDACTSQAWVH